jgi:acyl-CoA thioester hydrolase
MEGAQPARPEPFAHGLRVRYAECDPQGVVFNAHYLAYFDASITELWRAAFGGYRVMMDRGVDLVVAEAQLRFRAPARFDDELTLEISVTRMGNTAITSAHRIGRGAEVVVEGTLRHVVVDLATLTKMPIPDWIRDGLAPWAAEEDPVP